MKHVLALVALAAAGLSVAAPASAQQYSSPDQERARFEAARDRFDREYRLFQQASERYANYSDWLAHAPPPPPPRIDARDEGDWEPSRYYRPGGSERVLSADDRVYRGQDGRYYCKRPDGTTGLIVGAAAGGLFGNAISSRHSSTVGTLLGAIAGGAIGNSIDRNNQMNNQDVRCR